MAKHLGHVAHHTLAHFLAHHYSWDAAYVAHLWEVAAFYAARATFLFLAVL